MNIYWSLLYMLVFPGFLFITSFAFTCQYIDRKLYARFQKRVGPPFIQPIADFIKLLSKEDIVPKAASRVLFTAAPLVAFAAVITAFMYIPVFMNQGLIPSFEGDIVMVLYLMTIPTLAIFIAGIASGNPFGQTGSMRAITLMISYEIPFFIALLTPALILGSWSLGTIVDGQQFANGGIWMIVLAPIAFVVAILTLQGKLERLPFDAPEAETEIVGGPLTEYSGRRLAIFKSMLDLQMVVGSALIAVLFLGGYDVFVDVGDMGLHWTIPVIVGSIAFFLKVLLVVFILALIKSVVARYRIDQVVKISYRYLLTAAIVQLLIVVLIKYALVREWIGNPGGWF